MSELIYLDNAATTKPFGEVVLAMAATMQEGFFNPSALYAKGVHAQKSVEACRGLLKSKLFAEEIVFTSGGTEANNLAILGLMASRRTRGRILYSAIEHSAVAETCRALSVQHEVISLPVDREGVLDIKMAREHMTPDTDLICLMQVNNEVGSIQPISELAKLRDEVCPKAHLHVDGVQGFLKIKIGFDNGMDSYALSAHKIHGPKGVGALALKKGVRLKPLVFGGKQEEGLRSGTENTDGIAGLMAAIQNYPSENQMARLKDLLYQLIREGLPQVQLNGPLPLSAASSPHILNLSFPPLMAQTLMHQLEAQGVLVSQGSACSSRQRKPNATLSAMGLPANLISSALRFSLSCFTSQSEIETAARAVLKAYDSLRPYTRR